MSCFCEEIETSLQVVLGVFFPIFLISGIIWPLEVRFVCVSCCTCARRPTSFLRPGDATRHAVHLSSVPYYLDRGGVAVGIGARLGAECARRVACDQHLVRMVCCHDRGVGARDASLTALSLSVRLSAVRAIGGMNT